MKTGKIVLIPFPFTELTNIKVRPAVYISQTKDAYQDIIVCAVSSILSKELTENEFVVVKDDVNELRKDSVVKVDRIVTLKRKDIIANLGQLNEEQIKVLKNKFKGLIE